MAEQRHILEEDQIVDICNRTEGYSCADMTNVCKEAAFGPIRSIAMGDIEHITPDQVRRFMWILHLMRILLLLFIYLHFRCDL